MPIRWVICPITVQDFPAGHDFGPDPETGEPQIINAPFKKWHIEIRDNVRARVETRAESPDGKWALCQLLIPSPADDDIVKSMPGVVRVFEDDEEPDFDWVGRSLKNRSPRSKGWNQGRLNRFRNFLSSRGIPDPGFNLDTPLDVVIDFIADGIRSGQLTA